MAGLLFIPLGERKYVPGTTLIELITTFLQLLQWRWIGVRSQEAASGGPIPFEISSALAFVALLLLAGLLWGSGDLSIDSTIVCR